MKLPLLPALLLLAVLPAAAQESFPGLKSVLTESEWKRAGLDRLTPDELGVIDAALIRREVAQQRQLAAATSPAAPANAPIAGQPATPGLWSRLGLPTNTGPEWRDVPPLQAKVTKWETPSRFVLDNGQAWQSSEPIVYELVGKNIEIQARPNQSFALVVEGINTTIRVTRVR